MILIVGLGNPGKKYELTRHNIGFKIVDRFADSLDEKNCYQKFLSAVIELFYGSHRIVILKPRTFMNRSGDAVASFSRYYKNKIESILVIHDDIDIKFGEIKLKRDGNTGGHKGLESIVNSTGNSFFDRLRFGVGRPPGRQDAADYVLREFSKKEKDEVEVLVEKTVDVIRDYITEGIEFTMNKYN